MAVSTYSELLTELDGWLNRSDLTARLPTFIRMFEARCNRTLRVPEMETTQTYTTASGTAELALPDDYLAPREIFLNTTPIETLEGVSPPILRKLYSSDTTGKPMAYAVVANQMVLAPTPDDAYELTLSYYQAVPALTEDNTSNWLLDEHPDIYLFGTLCMAEAFLRDDERVAVWKGAWDEALGELIRQGNAQRLPGAPLVARSTVIE